VNKNGSKEKSCEEEKSYKEKETIVFYIFAEV